MAVPVAAGKSLGFSDTSQLANCIHPSAEKWNQFVEVGMPWPSCICTGLQSYQPHFSWHMPRPFVRWHGRDANWSQMGLQSFLWKAWNKNGQHRAWPGLDREAGLDIAPLLDGGLHASQEIFRLLSSDQIRVYSGKAASAKPKQSLIRICLRPSPANPGFEKGFSVIHPRRHQGAVTDSFPHVLMFQLLYFSTFFPYQ